VSISVFEHRSETQYRPVTGAVARRATLAFTYTNQSDERFDHLLLFGVDEHFTVYWFYPAWTDPSTTPTAYPISTGSNVRLPDDVTHQYATDRLRVFALFTRQRSLSVRDVERLIQRIRKRGASLVEFDRLPLSYTGQHSLLLRIGDR